MDFRTSFPSIVCLLSFLLLVCVGEIFAKTLRSRGGRHSQRGHDKTNALGLRAGAEFRPKRCLCQIQLHNGTVLVDYGEIATYNWPSSECHQVHHHCRTACSNKLNLYSLTPSGSKQGYEMCRLYGRNTEEPVYLSALWETPNCQQHKNPVRSKRRTRLCCGHTTFARRPNTAPSSELGWNTDCHARRYFVHQ